MIEGFIIDKPFGSAKPDDRNDRALQDVD